MSMTGHGGARPGAGRPRQDPMGKPRRRRSVYCTEDELEKIRIYLKLLRGGAVMDRVKLQPPDPTDRVAINHFVDVVNEVVETNHADDHRVLLVHHGASAESDFCVAVYHVAGAGFRDRDEGELTLTDADWNTVAAVPLDCVAFIELEADLVAIHFYDTDRT